MTISIRNCTFAFKCDKKWDELAITRNTGIRFCDVCQREVFFCDTENQLAEAIALNRCVAFTTEVMIDGRVEVMQLTGDLIPEKVTTRDDIYFDEDNLRRWVIRVKHDKYNKDTLLDLVDVLQWVADNQPMLFTQMQCQDVTIKD